MNWRPIMRRIGALACILATLLALAYLWTRAPL